MIEACKRAFKRAFQDRYLMLSVCGLVLLSTPLMLMCGIDYIDFLRERSVDIGFRTNVAFDFLLQDAVRFLNKCVIFTLGIGIVGLLIIFVAWSLMVRRDYLIRHSPKSDEGQ